MVPLLIYNMVWSFKGLMQFTKGISYPASVYQSVVFLLCAGIFGAHSLALMGKAFYDWSSPYVLIIQCMFFSAASIAAYGRKVAVTSQFEEFYWLFNSNNLDLAVRAAQLAEFDRDFAARSIDAAETAAAVKLANRVLNGDND